MKWPGLSRRTPALVNRVLRPIPAAALDLVLAPGAAFDLSGMRMGYGKGYYDRFLSDPEMRGWVVGLAYRFQVVERLPVEPHDRPMNALATETGFVSVPR